MCYMVFRKQSFKSYVTDLFVEVDNILYFLNFSRHITNPSKKKPHFKTYALLIHKCIMLIISYIKNYHK